VVAVEDVLGAAVEELAAGLNTATIAELLPCMIDDGEGLRPGCAGLLPDLRWERDRLTGAVAELLAARDALDTIINATGPLEPAGACAVPAGA
ncbi:hypothetical protein C1I98_38230, partial [Spongiactinospora gelatinilytica]